MVDLPATESTPHLPGHGDIYLTRPPSSDVLRGGVERNGTERRRQNYVVAAMTFYILISPQVFFPQVPASSLGWVWAFQSGEDSLSPKDGTERLITKGRPRTWRASCRCVVGADNLPNTIQVKLRPQSSFADEINPGFKPLSTPTPPSKLPHPHHLPLHRPPGSRKVIFRDFLFTGPYGSRLHAPLHNIHRINVAVLHIKAGLPSSSPMSIFCSVPPMNKPHPPTSILYFDVQMFFMRSTQLRNVRGVRGIQIKAIS